MGVDRRGGAAVNEYAANAARSRSVTFETTFHLDPTRSSEYVDKFMTRLRHSHDRTKTNKKVKKAKIAPLTILNSGALQPRKWQLTGNDCSTAAQGLFHSYLQ